MSNNFYGKLFAKRATICFIVVILFLLSCVLRVTVISTQNYSEIQIRQSSYRIEVATLRGTIYDCNMIPLTNQISKTIAAVSPTPKGVMAINTALEGENREIVLSTLKENKPAIFEVKKEISNQDVISTVVYEHTPKNNSACHIIGYTDDSGHGVSGLELAYDDYLYSDKKVSAVFCADGKGNVLEGVEPYFENDLSVVHSGVVSTIDINFQNIIYDVAKNLTSGCAIVAEADTAKIRAMVSVPTFDLKNISASLMASDSPFLNRALSAFSVGSVFKPCVAAAAIEMGEDYHIFNCEGKLNIVDRDFRCHKLTGHGQMNLCTALANSCNCFFYNFAIMLGGESIYNMASSLSFGTKIKIAENFYTKAGKIPKLKTLNNLGTLANLSIGQGDLLLSPISMLTLYCAIAGDGSYYLPSVVEKTIKDGEEQQFDIGNKTKVFSSDTALALRRYLQTVITDGTGSEAAPNNCTAAGKTATAQTGRYYETGEEITNSWFCGFFPVENPKYVVIVMSDSKSSVSTASIFAQIADRIIELKDLNVEIND